MKDLIAIATRMRVRVHVSHLDDPEVQGVYDHELRAIHLSFDLTPNEMRSVLAHEIAHAHYGDTCSDGAEERRAERFAAALLVTPQRYAEAEAVDPHPSAIADELGVTEDVIVTYQQHCLQRLGERTYGRSPRVGLFGALARQLSS